MYSIYIHICILKKEKYSLNEHMYSKLAQNHSSYSFSSPTQRPNDPNSLPHPPVWVTDGVSGLLFPISHERKFFSPDTSCDLLVAGGAGSGTSASGWRARRVGGRHGGVPCPCAALWLCPGPASRIRQGGDRQQRAIRESVCRNIFPNYLCLLIKYFRSQMRREKRVVLQI
jgi:hypothetical protein